VQSAVRFFEDKLDIITKLGIKVHPSEDLKSMKVACQLNLEQVQPKELIDGKKPVKLHVRGKHELNNECGKVMLAPPLDLAIEELSVRETLNSR